jgi:rhodanese-related sulfurtransferase
MATSVDEMLAQARSGLERVGPRDAAKAMDAGAVMIDIRSETQRATDGIVPGAEYIARNVLEWRLDPASPDRIDRLARPEAHVIVMCDAGYQSSLVAETLQRLGLPRATDLAGGFQAWRAAGLPVEPPRS